ncbi:MAG: hypothetical protein MUE73_08660 [Planctomycetes bacterium]|jgi:hypothetical protein|nr:hypothetical protein [Planctomycetota bacterium]
MIDPGYTELESVFEGEIGEATVLRASLRAAGFETVVPSENIKVTDPFVTGAGALYVSLRARRDEAEQVRAVIAELRARAAAEEDDPVDRELLHRARRRIRLGWIVVLAILLGFPTVILVILAGT